MRAARGTAQLLLSICLGYHGGEMGEEWDLGVAKHLMALAFPLHWIIGSCKSFHIKQEVEKHLGETPCLGKSWGGSS